MSYSINGKVYTDHPLLDEIIYNCKLILNGLVVKNDVLANNYETAESIKDAEILILIKNGNLSLTLCPFTYDSLIAFGYDRKLANSCLIDHNNVPVADREEIIKFTSDYFLEHFEEKNKYYRMLIGLPEYGTNEYDIYLDESYFPSNIDKDIDFSKPLHKMDDDIINILESSGKINELLEKYKGSNYSYIRFLGSNRLDIYNIRKAGKWDILYMPPVESLVSDRFKELYNLNKDVYLKRTYQDAYAFSSKYYEQCMIIVVICQTFTDMIVDVPEWYIRRDIFDIRSVQYFLDSYGVKFFKEIPLKYQIRIVKNLNKLIKYKSSNRNNIDILEIFSLKDTAIYKYYLYKKRLVDKDGNYIESDNISDKFDLEFVQCKLGDTYDNYIKDKIYRIPYDDITYQDKYWDGEDSHQYIKDLHMNRDFTIESTKYMSLDYKVSSSEYFYQIQYFLGLVLNSSLDSKDITICIPSIQSYTNFKLSDLFLFLSLISFGYDDCSTGIIRPKQINVNSEVSYGDKFDWMKDRYPDVFRRTYDRVYGFNSDVDMDKLSEILSEIHSQFQFTRGFTLEELGVKDFVPPKKVSSIDELLDIYRTNTKCYNELKNKMVNDADDRDEYIVMEFVFDYLFTKQFDYSFCTLSNGAEADKLELILKDRDITLYNTYQKLVSDQDVESRRDNIRIIMNDVINTLDYYIGADDLEHIFAFTSVSSFNSLINYMYLMINFFKSYKVYFLDPYITYNIDDPLENSAKAIDCISEKDIEFEKFDKEFHRETIMLDCSLDYDEKDPKHVIETLDIFGEFDPDPYDDYDYDGGYDEDTGVDFKIADGSSYSDNGDCIPYSVIDGGANDDVLDLFDINGFGSNSIDGFEDIDGGKATDYVNIESVDVGANISGGNASTTYIYDNAMHVKVIDDQETVKAVVSKRHFYAVNEAIDGLYLYPKFAYWSEFKDLGDTSDTFEYYSSLYNDQLDIIKIGNNNKNDNEYEEKCIGLYAECQMIVIKYVDNYNLEQRVTIAERRNLENYFDIELVALFATGWGLF